MLATERLNDPRKNWKWRLDDLTDRELWDEYTDAYREALKECSTRRAPWYVVPADHKAVRIFGHRPLLLGGGRTAARCLCSPFCPSGALADCDGTWRSPVAHFLGVEGVAGSNPVVPMLVTHKSIPRRPGIAPGRCAFDNVPS